MGKLCLLLKEWCYSRLNALCHGFVKFILFGFAKYSL